MIDSYLTRIGLADAGAPSVSALRRIHAAHVASIPFENLDILLGRPIELDLERLRAKLVDQRRGGYCFEHNTLLLAVLRELGFTAEPMEARVRMGTSIIRPRTHMILVVTMDGEAWLADVGFGADGPLEPVPMSGAVVNQHGISYRVATDGPLRVLQHRSSDDWSDLYAFTPQAVYPVDVELANWFTSTFPQSPFVKTLTAQRTTPDVRHILRYPTYSEIRGREVRTVEIGRAELLPILREVFLIDLPDETTFAVIDDAPPRRPRGLPVV